MNNKGQLGAGALLMAAIGVIVALTLLAGNGAISGNVGQVTTTSTITNETFTLAAANGYTDRPNCVNIQGTPILINNSGDSVVIGAGNYSATTRVSPTTGLKVLTFRTIGTEFDAYSVNASYTCMPQGYAEDSASRTMMSLIILLAAIALMAFVLFFVIKNVQGMM